jgi:hypothetical protein
MLVAGLIKHQCRLRAVDVAASSTHIIAHLTVLPFLSERSSVCCFEKVEPHGIQNSETLSQPCFTPVLAKHSKSFSLIDCVSVGVDRTAKL